MLSKAKLLEYIKTNNFKFGAKSNGDITTIYLYDEIFCTEEWWTFLKTKMISCYTVYLGRHSLLSR